MRWQGFATAATVCAVVAAAAVTFAPNLGIANLGIANLGIANLGIANLPAAQPQRGAAGDFPNVTLTTQDGQRVRFYDDLLKGKSVAIDLIYTDCKDECPLETARLVQVQKLLGDRIGKDLFFYSITIDPKHDTPEVLKDYADKFHVGPGWLFLTGDEGDIQKIAKKLGLPYDLNASADDGHGPTIVIGDEPTGQWTQRSAEDNPRFMASTIRTFFGWPSDEPARSYADAKPLQIDRGGYVYQTRCVGCHTVGQGDLVGPDLAGVTARRDSQWLSQYISDPSQMLQDGDPVATALFEKYRRVRMPDLGLDDEDVQAIIAYLDRSANASTGAPAAGDAAG